MEQQILIPDIGDYSNVEIIEVAIKDGDQLNKDDTMVTLETDKATMDIPAPFNLKIIKVLLKVGDRVSQGSVIANATNIEILTEKADPKVLIEHNVLENSETHNLQVKVTSSEVNSAKISNKQELHKLDNSDPNNNSSSNSMSGLHNANPSVRKLARELGVNLNNVIGTAKHGRIVEQDIKSYVNQVLNKNISNNNINDQNLNKNISIDFSKWGTIKEQPLSRIKKKSGQNLHKNWLNIPHVTHFDTADITELENFRKQLIQSSTVENLSGIKKSLDAEKLSTVENFSANSKKNDVKITLLVFLIKVVASALQKFPYFNSSLSLDGENLILKNYYNIGIAVNTGSGLVVPVIKNVDQKDIFTLAQELNLFSQKAKENKLIAEDLQGGCFTISSLGGIAGNNFTPIINAPEVAILGVSRHKITPEFINQELQPRLILPLALSYDHRVIDGAEAAWFCNYITQQLKDSKNFYV